MAADSGSGFGNVPPGRPLNASPEGARAMRFMFTLLLLTIGIGAFLLGSSRPAAAEARQAPPPRPKRRIPPEQTAAAAAERWYDEA